MCHAEAKPPLRFAHGFQPFYALHYAPGLARHTQALDLADMKIHNIFLACCLFWIASVSIANEKSFAEEFDLSKLSYVGSFTKGDKIFALLSTDSNQLIRVELGGFLGKDYGQLKSIDEQYIEICELFYDYEKKQWFGAVSILQKAPEGAKSKYVRSGKECKNLWLK